MGYLKEHVNLKEAARYWLAGRFSRHPERYIELFRVARKYELHHVAAQLGITHRHEEEDFLFKEHNAHEEEHAAGLTSALEELGPCFIKLGQMLSTRPDLLPPHYISALSRLQDTVKPVPAQKITMIIEGELGAPVEELFQTFDCTTLATASMAQVHRAVLRNGDEVVVKVQRPGVRHRIEVDLEILHEIATFATRYTAFGARYGLLQIVRELENSLSQELDFQVEADNTRLISRQIADFPLLITPTVYSEYTSRRVLTLGFIRGRHLADVSDDELKRLDAPAIAKELLSAYLKQSIIDGVFHCDPHPGNIFLTGNNRLALLDFGMVGRFDSGQKDQVILLLLAFSERQGERVADTYMEMVQVPKDVDRMAFSQDVCALVSRYHDMSGGRMAIGTALLDLTRLAQKHCMPIPGAMTLLGKAMLNLDGTIRVLSPELDPVQLIRDYMLEVMEKRVMGQLSPGRTFAWVLDMKHLFEDTPRRASMVFDKLANDRLTMRLEVEQLESATKALDRAANKLSLSIIVASVIVGGGFVANWLGRKGSPRQH